MIARAAELQRTRAQLETQLRTLRRLHREAVDKRDAAQASMDRWQEAWRDCLSTLKRPLEETPAGVERAIELIEEAHSARQHVADLDHRIDGMRANISGFASKIAAVVAAAAPDLEGRSAEDAAQELCRRLDAHRDIAARRDQLRQQQEEAREKLAEAEAGQRRAELARDNLRREIGGTSDEENTKRLKEATERAKAEASLQDCERELAKIGDGWSISTLEGEIAAIAVESVEPALARLQLESERITNEREQAAAEEQALTEGQRRMETGENAIEAEEARQAAIASLTRISAEALLYHAAASLLEAGLERLRNSEDGGLLRRIGIVFSRITGGAYPGVDADEDDKGRPFLIMVEADGVTRKRVDQLSEGTRDQLFLALRLVMLEDYAAKAPALPVHRRRFTSDL